MTTIESGASAELLPFLPEISDMGPIEAATMVAAAFAGRTTHEIGSLRLSPTVGTSSPDVDAIIDLFNRIYAAASSGAAPQTAAPQAAQKEPAVPIRKSVFPDYIVCLEDGKKFKSLKRHLSTHFNLTPDEYRAKWGLPADYPLVAPNYAAVRSQLAKNSGLGKKS